MIDATKIYLSNSLIVAPSIQYITAVHHSWHATVQPWLIDGDSAVTVFP